MTDADIPNHFNGQPQNIGVLLGEPSGWLVDVDVDHMEAVALAREYLPPTDARFGRESKPESHYLYHVCAPLDTAKFQTSTRVMLVELRATGCQTVFPGSTHPSGEVIRWDHEGEPATIDPAELLEAAQRLAESTSEQIGETIKHPAPAMQHRRATQTTGDADRAWRYVTKMPNAISGQGGHNATYNAACECFRFGLFDADARQLLGRFNAEKCSPLWTDSELDHKLADARERVMADGEFGCRLTEQSDKPRKSRTINVAAELQNFPLTDSGIAERFAANNRGTFCYSHERGAWFTYTGKVWRPDNTGGAVRRAAKEQVRKLASLAAQTDDDKTRRALLDHARACESLPKIKALIELARAELPVTMADMDRESWLLNAPNGTLDLQVGKLRPHRAADLITKLISVPYDPRAICPTFDLFVARIFEGDAALIAYVQRLLGYCITAIGCEQIIAVFHGVGANGKSTMLDLIVWLLGDYADTAPPDLLIQRSGDEHPTELADLCGKRLIVASESEHNRKLRVQLVKRLTGDELLKARFMRQDYFSFRRTFTIILVTNNLPKVDEDTEAVWRRLRLVPFNVVIPQSERDPQLLDKLKTEGPGILRWLVEGCRAWQRDGLREPEAVTHATGEYRADSNPLHDFVRDCCIVGPDLWAASSDLRREYERFSAERGDKPLAGGDFTDAIKRHGCTPARRHAGRGWAGIGLRSDQIFAESEAMP